MIRIVLSEMVGESKVELVERTLEDLSTVWNVEVEADQQVVTFCCTREEAAEALFYRLTDASRVVAIEGR